MNLQYAKTPRYRAHLDFIIIIMNMNTITSSITDSCISLRQFPTMNLFKYSFHICDYLGDAAVAAAATVS